MLRWHWLAVLVEKPLRGRDVAAVGLLVRRSLAADFDLKAQAVAGTHWVRHLDVPIEAAMIGREERYHSVTV